MTELNKHKAFILLFLLYNIHIRRDSLFSASTIFQATPPRLSFRNIKPRMCNSLTDNRFISLETTGKIWAIPSVHGDLERITALHDAILDRFEPGDRVVYLGNYTGYGTQPVEAIDEILTFRRIILSQPGVTTEDIVYLRGAQEDMWQKLMHLPYHPAPIDMLLWMLSNGMANTFLSYGICAHDGVMAAREGTMFLTRWIGSVRGAIRDCPGHDIFNTQFKRAAYTQKDDRFPLLFVNAGIDPSLKLEHQEDVLCWGGDSFTDIQNAYDPFEKVVRGFDPSHNGVHVNCVTASLDGGCGFGGPLVAASMTTSGEFLEFLEA